MKTALIDGDIIVYKACFYHQANTPYDTEEELKVLCCDAAVALVEEWAGLAQCTSILVMLSDTRENNFRRALWPAYKEQRNKLEKPKFLVETKQALREAFIVLEFPGLEADDLLGIYATEPNAPDERVIISIDKDLQQIPGWFFNPDKHWEPVYISPEEAEYKLNLQWLMGDYSDNIPGIPKVGQKKAEKFLAEGAHPLDIYLEKDLDEAYADTMFRLVKILTYEDFDFETLTPKFLRSLNETVESTSESSLSEDVCPAETEW